MRESLLTPVKVESDCAWRNAVTEEKEDVKKVLVVTRHTLLPSQMEWLQAKFGADMQIVPYPDSFDGVNDILRTYEREKCEEMVYIGPDSVLRRLLELNLHPWVPEMNELPRGQKGEVKATKKRGPLCFKRFRRVRTYKFDYFED